MAQDLLDHAGILNDGDQPQVATTPGAPKNILGEHPPKKVGPREPALAGRVVRPSELVGVSGGRGLMRLLRYSIELWDCPDICTLGTYDGPIRVVRARITDLSDPRSKPRNWCVAVTGRAARRLSAHQVLRVARGRWHLENTGFHQWTKHWKFRHVFRHTGNAVTALFWYFFAAYDLLTLFLYRQLRCYGRDRGKDKTRTISRFVDQILDDLARLTCSPWDPG